MVVTVAPMAKKDAASKRLAEEIAFAKRINDRIKDPPSLSLLDLANPDEKEKLAASLWLDEKDPLLVAPILDAFKAFGLDHRSVGDWYRLATHLARVLFARRRPGPSKKWTAERLCLLLADVAAYKRKHPKASDSAICGWLKKSYARVTVEAYGAHCRTRVIPSAIASLLRWPTLWRERRRETGPQPLKKPPLLRP